MARYILVVEKDTVFQRIIDDTTDSMRQTFILMTAKGYPDVNTRLLLKKLQNFLGIPMYILVDADPHGIEIFFTYRFGSMRMSHLTKDLAISNMKWLGVLPSDIDTLDIQKLALAKSDEKKLQQMLKRPYINSNFAKEMNILLNKKYKAEIEGILNISKTFLTGDYIPAKIRQDFVCV